MRMSEVDQPPTSTQTTAESMPQIKPLVSLLIVLVFVEYNIKPVHFGCFKTRVV